MSWGHFQGVFLAAAQGDFFAVGCVSSLERHSKAEKQSEKSPPRRDGHATIPSPPFSSRDLGHACTCAWCEFKP